MPLNTPNAGMYGGRYTESPPVVYNIEKGMTKETPFKEDFTRSSKDGNKKFGKYGVPNAIQIRNNSTARLKLTINNDDDYVYQIPPLLFETYNLEEEGIKHIKIENIEDFETDDLIQIIAAKEITQNMVNRLVYGLLSAQLSKM